MSFQRLADDQKNELDVKKERSRVESRRKMNKKDEVLIIIEGEISGKRMDDHLELTGDGWRMSSVSTWISDVTVGLKTQDRSAEVGQDICSSG